MTSLAKTFDKTKTDITWGITLVLMFRSVGSVLFGIASDRYGRKWPFVINNILFIILELVSLVPDPCCGSLGAARLGNLGQAFCYWSLLLT